MKTLLVVVAVYATFFSPLSFAANCKKGQPCGNSCISWAKTCRIGTYKGSATSAGEARQSDVYQSAKSSKRNETQNFESSLNSYKVIVDKLNIRAEPNSASKITGKLSRGSIIRPLTTSGAWLKIRYNTSLGWVHSDYLKKI